MYGYVIINILGHIHTYIRAKARMQDTHKLKLHIKNKNALQWEKATIDLQ